MGPLNSSDQVSVHPGSVEPLLLLVLPPLLLPPPPPGQTVPPGSQPVPQLTVWHVYPWPPFAVVHPHGSPRFPSHAFALLPM